MRIAIGDDVAADLRTIGEALDAYLEVRGRKAEVVSFLSPDELLAAARRSAFDLYLLDVLLAEDMTGIDLVRQLRALRNAEVPVVFFSTSREYALEAFSVEAVSYFQKPWTQELFFRALDRAFEVCQRAQEELLTFSSNGEIVRFSAAQIESVTTARTVNYVTVTPAAGEPLTVRGSVTGFVEQHGVHVRLVPAGRSVLVNPAQIAALEKDEVRFFSGRTLSVPRSALTAIAKEILALSCPSPASASAACRPSSRNTTDSSTTSTKEMSSRPA